MDGYFRELIIDIKGVIFNHMTLDVVINLILYDDEFKNYVLDHRDKFVKQFTDITIHGNIQSWKLFNKLHREEVDYNGMLLPAMITIIEKFAFGSNNIAIGYGALVANTTGAYNCAVGSNAILTTGNNNDIIGSRTLLTTGSNNDIIGSRTLLTTGSNNDIIGSRALLTTGSNNDIIRSRTLLTTGSNNGAIGLRDIFNLQQNNININNFALTPDDHQPSGTCNYSRINETIRTSDYPDGNLYIGKKYTADDFINNPNAKYKYYLNGEEIY